MCSRLWCFGIGSTYSVGSSAALGQIWTSDGTLTASTLLSRRSSCAPIPGLGPIPLEHCVWTHCNNQAAAATDMPDQQQPYFSLLSKSSLKQEAAPLSLCQGRMIEQTPAIIYKRYIIALMKELSAQPAYLLPQDGHVPRKSMTLLHTAPSLLQAV